MTGWMTDHRQACDDGDGVHFQLVYESEGHYEEKGGTTVFVLDGQP